jgi:endonuclease YncB( thermonuclease family)
MKYILFIFFLPLVFLSSISANAADFQAKVIHIADGDTITVLNDANEQVKVRLNGIDCPEKAQAYGNKAKQFTKELVAGQAVPVCEKAQEC